MIRPLCRDATAYYFYSDYSSLSYMLFITYSNCHVCSTKKYSQSSLNSHTSYTQFYSGDRNVLQPSSFDMPQHRSSPPATLRPPPRSCHFHTKFVEAARHCRAPCAWQAENAQAAGGL